MPTLKRLSVDTFVSVFRSASAGKSRLPLRRAFCEFARLFYGFNDKVGSRGASLMAEYYLRGVDVRLGVRSHALMVGGPKNLRGNPRGGLDSRLFYPSITCEQFVLIGRVRLHYYGHFDMLQALEQSFIERHFPHVCDGRLRCERSTSEVASAERHHQRALLSSVERELGGD